MTLLWGIGTAIAVTYGLLCGVTGIVQIRKREIAMWSAIAMSITGAGIAVSALALMWVSQLLTMLIISLLIIHILTIANGLHLYNKINIRHHFVRFVISAGIVAFFIFCKV